jgi:flagellar P-ring protein precursor FlgI
MRLAFIPTLLLAALTLPVSAHGAARLKELVTLEGVRDNQLIGYGLVVGLNKTGDRLQTVFSAQSLTNLLQRMGVSVPPDAIRVNNTASVMVTATLPPFAQPGTKIDATAAAIGDASSLQGGLLLLTSLRASDGQVYAVVQGPVVTGGFVAGRTGTSATVNHPTVGRVPNGAIVERAAPSVTPSQTVHLQLRTADFTTAARISDVINEAFGKGAGNVAIAENSALVSVNMPAEYATRPAAFIAQVERLEVEADRTARVVINERTGTIVMGKQVKISPIVVLHGNLTVEIETGFNVSQPAPFSEKGETTVVPEVNVGIREEQARNIVLPEGATVEQLVRALMAIGSTPRDIIAILQNIRTSGALEADLEVI